MILSLFLSMTATASTHSVDSVEGLRRAVDQAVAGDRIQLAPGTYRLEDSLRLAASGSATQPIRIDGSDGVLVEVDALVGFRVTGAHWQLAQLTVEGVCGRDHDCEHAFHVVGRAEGFVLEDSTLRNFNAQIKVNGEDGSFPDGGRLVGNELYNESPRETDRPVVPIDVVGANDWWVEGNHIHDFEKAGGNGVSYAAFFKGNGSGGHFERNLIVCEDLHAGGIRLGLSLGGGGTAPDSVCRDEDCSVEHTGGVMVNNIIARCPSDVGIYLNAAADSLVAFNTLSDTTGIDVRFSHSSARLVGNVLDGRIRERDGGTAVLESESPVGPAEVYWDPTVLDFGVEEPEQVWIHGDAAPETDFCGSLRSERTVLGAVDVASDCDTSMLPTYAEEPEEGTDPQPGDELGEEPGGDGVSEDSSEGADSEGADSEGGSPESGADSADGDGRSKGSSEGCSVSPLAPSAFPLLAGLSALFFRRRSS